MPFDLAVARVHLDVHRPNPTTMEELVTGSDIATTGTTTDEAIDPSPSSTDVDPAATTGVTAAPSGPLEFTLSDGGTTAQLKLSSADGGVEVSVSAPEDILGIFFDVSDDSKLGGASATGSDVVASEFSANSVSKPGNNPGINPGSFDGGVATGNPGAGRGVLTETSFVISGVTLEELSGQSFGVRTQSSKLTGNAAEIAPPTMPDTTDDMADDDPVADSGDSIDEVPDTVDEAPDADSGSGDSVDEVSDAAAEMDADTAITIDTSGEFGDPLSPGSAVYEVLDADGGEDNRFEWGVPVDGSFVNVLQFDGKSFEAIPDEIISLGDLLYTNGTVNKAFNGEFPFTLKLDISGLTDEDEEEDDDEDTDESSDTVDEVVAGSDSSDDDDADDDADDDDDADADDDDDDDDADDDSDTSGSSGSIDEVVDDGTDSSDADDAVDDSLSFEFLFDIFNSPNTTGDPVLDGDRLRLNSGGVAPVSFEVDGQEYTIQLLGFSSDGGSSIRTGFNSPEESTANAELYAKIVPLSGEVTEFYEPLDDSVVNEVIGKGGISIGGDASGQGAVAVSLLIKSEITLQIAWGNTVSALTSTYESVSDSDGDSDGDGLAEIDHDETNSNVVSTTDVDEEIEGTIDSDVVASGGGNDDIDCAEGNDIAVGMDGDDAIDGGDGIDIVNGNQGADDVDGGAGDDIARGGQGNDNVDGGAGDDVLTGDRGVDEITGGAGADTFALMAQIDVETQTSYSVDIITDFQAGVDRLAISAERFEKQDINFSISDYNGDSSPDFIASFNSGQVFGVVLNVSDTNFVRDNIVQSSMDDFVNVDESIV